MRTKSVPALRLTSLVDLPRRPASALLTALLVLAMAPAAWCEPVPVPTAEQIARITPWLPEKPVGVGAPIGNRPAWAEAARQPAFQKQVKDAEQFAREPIPELNSDALFAQVAATGRRDIYEKPFRARTTRLVAFVVAECVQDTGKYLPQIEAELRAILDEKTWGLAAPLVDTTPYGGMEGVIDLASSARAFTVVTADYWLGDRLKPETRRDIRANVQRRIFEHYEETVRAGKAGWWWMVSPNNWNPVCTSGVLGTALTLIDSPRERAFYVQAALDSLSHYSGAFPDDGYCSEGVGYWDYGFGTFLCSAETLYQQTHGKINLYAGANVHRMALFMRRLEIVPGVFPAFGDANPRTHGGSPALMSLINRRWKMGWTGVDSTQSDMFRAHPLGDRLFGFGIFGFPWPDEGPAGDPASGEERASEDKRTFFNDSSVLICRSLRPGRPAFGMAVKGGRNGGGGHSHIDAGSYVVASGELPLVADPGMENYTTRTFGPHRYESMMMNSYGHSVPFVGKTLQKGGPESEGKVVATHFTDEEDTLTMDLTSGYPVPGMIKLTRTYVFNRVQPSVEVIDEADFNRPTDYGSAVVTLSDARERGPGSFLIDEKNTAVAVTVTVEGAGPGVQVENKVEPVTGFLLPANTKPLRLGVNLSKPVTHLVLRTRIVPTAPPGK